MLGIGETDIWYVKNYKEELDVDDDKDILIASVLKVAYTRLFAKCRLFIGFNAETSTAVS